MPIEEVQLVMASNCICYDILVKLKLGGDRRSGGTDFTSSGTGGGVYSHRLLDGRIMPCL